MNKIKDLQQLRAEITILRSKIASEESHMKRDLEEFSEKVASIRKLFSWVMNFKKRSDPDDENIFGDVIKRYLSRITGRVKSFVLNIFHKISEKFTFGNAKS